MAQRSTRSSLRQQLVNFDKNFRRELQGVAQETGRELLNKHREAVADWTPQNRPDFALTVSVQPTLISVSVVPRGRSKRIFRFVNEGTKAHTIQPRQKPYLKFQMGHSAKTKPIAKFKQGNGGRTGQWVMTKNPVNHPGTAPREFSKTFNAEVEPNLKRNTENAFRRAARKK